MWIAENWKDYELLDCGDGEKLERWGEQILVRPDPQAIMGRRPGAAVPGRTRHARYLRSNTGGGHWEAAQAAGAVEQVQYGELTFNVKPMNFKHTGLFPEQAVNWDFVMEKIRGAGRPDPGAEPVCLYRRRHGGLRGGGRLRLPCGCGQGHGGLGEGKRRALRTWRIRPFAGLWTTARKFVEREIRRGQTIRRDYHGSAFLRPGARPARCGSWRRTSIHLWSCAPAFCRTIRCL